MVGCLKNPLLEGGVATPIKKMQRYLSFGAAGEVRNLRIAMSDLPGCALANVSLHFSTRAQLPLLSGGANTLAND